MIFCTLRAAAIAAALGSPALAGEDPLLACLVIETTPTELNAWRKRMLRIYDDSTVAAAKRADQTFRLATVTLATSRCPQFADRLRTDEAEAIFETYGDYLDERAIGMKREATD